MSTVSPSPLWMTSRTSALMANLCVPSPIGMAGVPAKAAPVRLRRPFFARLVDRFAMRLASSIADEVELRTWNRYRF